MQSTSNVGSVEQNGCMVRLNPREIAKKLMAIPDGDSVSILEATDEQFNAFIQAAGISVKDGGEGAKWSFDNRCRVVNYSLRHGIKLPFVENKNTSDSEQKTLPEKRPEVAQEAS